MESEGSAFLDHTGRVVAADEVFRARLGLRAGDATALLARAEADAALRALLAGEGPDAVRVAGADGPVDVVRSGCAGGTFLHARPAGGLAATALEHAMQAIALSRIAGGVAHDVKNPLNAMALQIALLTDKIATAGEPVGSACANNLASLRNQISRVNDVVRRLVDVSDPGAANPFDLGALAADVASLFGHESRRRRVALSCEAAPGSVHAHGDGARAARLLLGIVWRGLARHDPDRVAVRAANEGDEAVVAVEPGAGADAALAWIPDVAAAAAREMGGRLVHERGAGGERLELRLRREIAP